MSGKTTHRGIIRTFRGALLDRKGSAITEFALLVPGLIAAVLALLEVGYYLWTFNGIEHAARETARYAITRGPWGSNWAGTAAALKTDMESYASSQIDNAGLTVSDATPTAVVDLNNRVLTISVSYAYSPLVVPSKLISDLTLGTTVAMDIQRP
ncbi:MAG: TadE/TadG family type IV pilus assembly protein [Alphaproteobacteria bacterium]